MNYSVTKNNFFLNNKFTFVISCILIMSWLVFGALFYVVGIFFYSYWLYQKSYIYFRPLTYQKENNSEIIDIHKIYEEFKVKEKLSFNRLFIGSLVFVVIRLPLVISFTLIMTFQLM